ncbi:MAG TPA: serine hydrolase [Thermoanaerobaculia bacterium]
MLEILPLIGAACLLAASPAFAADAPAPQIREARVDALFAEIDRSDVPGCALGIFQDGRIAYARGYGMANLELGVANSPHTVYDIGSLGKQFTAFSIYLLARDGKLSLDDDVRKFVPELPAFQKPVTIRHLLHHTGGLRDYIELLELEGHGPEDLTTAREALDTLTRQKAPLFAPGERYEYSNTGYFLLSWVVQRASGKSLRDFAQERIFGPLGMTHTQYNDEHGRIIPNRSQGYSPADGGGYAIEMSDFEQNGDGGVNTSIEDLFLWNRNFDDPAVGDKHIVEQMEETGVLNSGKKIDYASGQVIGSYRGLRTVGHTGSWAGYRALLYRFPEQRFSVACLCNRANIDRVAKMRQIADIYLADRMTKPAEALASPKTPAAVPQADLERRAGAYRDSRTGEIWFLSVQNGALVADAEGSRTRFDAAEADRFVARNGGQELRFDARASGARSGFTASEPEEESRRFEPIATWTPAPKDLAAFAGTYTSDEVPALFRFTVADGTLRIRHRQFEDAPWRPTLKDSFTLDGANATFLRDAAGKVTGLRLDVGDMRGIAFRRIGS